KKSHRDNKPAPGMIFLADSVINHCERYRLVKRACRGACESWVVFRMGRLASRSGRMRQGLTGAGFAAAVGICALISWAASGPPKLAHADAKAAPPAAAAGNAGTQLQPVNSTNALKTAEISVVRVLVVYRGFGGTPL